MESDVGQHGHLLGFEAPGRPDHRDVTEKADENLERRIAVLVGRGAERQCRRPWWFGQEAELGWHSEGVLEQFVDLLSNGRRNGLCLAGQAKTGDRQVSVGDLHPKGTLDFAADSHEDDRRLLVEDGGGELPQPCRQDALHEHDERGEIVRPSRS